MGKRREQLSQGGDFKIFIFEAKGSIGPVGVGGPWGLVPRRTGFEGLRSAAELLDFVGGVLVPAVQWGVCR